MVMLGTIAWLILNGLRGELPGSGVAIVEHVHAASWRLTHILTIVAIAITAAGLALLSGTLMDARAAALGHAGAMIAVPSGAVLGVGFAVEGFALSALADAYSAAPDEAARAMHLMQAELTARFINGTSFSFQTLFGLAVAMLAAATLLSREYPAWLCWLGIAGGMIWSLAGLLIFTQVLGAAPWMPYLPVAPAAVWMLGLGWLAWQRGRRAAQATSSLA